MEEWSQCGVCRRRKVGSANRRETEMGRLTIAVGSSSMARSWQGGIAILHLRGSSPSFDARYRAVVRQDAAASAAREDGTDCRWVMYLHKMGRSSDVLWR